MKYPAKLVLGGLIGISAVFLQNLVTLDKPNISAQASIISFAIALPMLSLAFLIREQPRVKGVAGKPSGSIRLVIRFVTQVGIIMSLAGTILAFWHALHAAGIVLIVSSIIAYIIYTFVIRYMKDNGLLEQEPEDDQPAADSKQLEQINKK